MNPSQEQDQTASNEFIEGELSEADLMKIAGGILDAKTKVNVLGMETMANVAIHS